MRETITCKRFKTVGKFDYSADFSQASSNIMVRFPDNEDRWQPVPFQVADCRHSRAQAERMIASYFR